MLYPPEKNPMPVLDRVYLLKFVCVTSAKCIKIAKSFICKHQPCIIAISRSTSTHTQKLIYAVRQIESIHVIFVQLNDAVEGSAHHILSTFTGGTYFPNVCAVVVRTDYLYGSTVYAWPHPTFPSSRVSPPILPALSPIDTPHLHWSPPRHHILPKTNPIAAFLLAVDRTFSAIDPHVIQSILPHFHIFQNLLDINCIAVSIHHFPPSPGLYNPHIAASSGYQYHFDIEHQFARQFTIDYSISRFQ